MKTRIVTLKYRKYSPEFRGKVWAQADIKTDGTILVTVSLYTADDASDRKDRFDFNAGTLRPELTPAGDRRWQYVYPNGHEYPGRERTVRDAVCPAILYAADIMARDLANAAKAN